MKRLQIYLCVLAALQKKGFLWFLILFIFKFTLQLDPAKLDLLLVRYWVIGFAMLASRCLSLYFDVQ